MVCHAARDTADQAVRLYLDDLDKVHVEVFLLGLGELCHVPPQRSGPQLVLDPSAERGELARLVFDECACDPFCDLGHGVYESVQPDLKLRLSVAPRWMRLVIVLGQLTILLLDFNAGRAVAVNVDLR